MPQETPPALPSEGGEAPGSDDGGRWRTSYVVPVLIVAMAAGLIGAIILLARAEQDAGTAALEAATVDGPLPVVVPYSDVGGLVVLEAMIGETGRPLPMILDTGAPTIVSEDIAARFAGSSVGTIAHASGAGQVITSDVAVIPRVAIGEAVFRDAGAVVGAIEPGNARYCITDSGFVGTGLLRAAAWQIDPTTDTVTIADGVESLGVEGATRLEIKPSTEVPHLLEVELPLDGGSLSVVIDSGADTWLAVHPDDLAAIEMVPTDALPAVNTRRSVAGASATTQSRWTSVELALADREYTVPIALDPTMPEGRGLAGAEFLSRFITTIDWPDGAIYLQPVEEVVPASPASVGLAWDDGFVVGSFVDGLPMSEGLVLGAEVLALDDDPVQGAPFDDFCARVVRGDGPDRYEMTIAGDPPLTVPVVPVEDFFER